MQQYDIISLIQGELWDRLTKMILVKRFAEIHPVKGKATTLVGMRRVGKTYTLLNKIKNLEKQFPRESILYLNLEDDRLGLTKYEDLTKIIDLFYRNTPANYKRPSYIFLDEVQVIAGWEKVARRLVETDRCELWLTGSSAKMLSKDVATQFRGRSMVYEVWPYDYFEYLEASHIAWTDPSVSFANRDLAREQLEHYLMSGGFPETVNASSETRMRILQDYRNAVVLRDVVERYQIKNLVAMEQLVSSLVINSGRLFSVNKFTNDLKSRGVPVGKDTIIEYLSYFEDAFFAFSVPIYQVSQRVQSTSPKKVFCVDSGMSSAYSLRPKADLGRLFENLVFVDLKRQGYRTFYYITKDGAEVDFVVVGHSGQPFIVQVCFDDSAPQTSQREQTALDKAMQELQCGGILVTPRIYTQSREWIPKL